MPLAVAVACKFEIYFIVHRGRKCICDMKMRILHPDIKKLIINRFSFSQTKLNKNLILQYDDLNCAN